MAVELKRSICGLQETLDHLSDYDRAVFEKIFRVSFDTSEMDLGPVALPDLKSQQVARIMNRWTHDGSVYNGKRLEKPQIKSDISLVVGDIEASRGGDPFCHVLEKTPLDKFGRIRCKYGQTAYNLYPLGSRHVCVIHDEHSYLTSQTEERFVDILELGEKWIHKTHEVKPELIFPVSFHNNGPTAAASINHPHTHSIVEKDFHQPGMEKLKDTANWYAHKNNGADYFADFFAAHWAVGLGVHVGGMDIIPHLAATKDWEVLVMSQRFGENEKSVLHKVYRAMTEVRGIRAFNLAIGYPPLEHHEDYDRLPVVISLVARNDPTVKNADWGGFEIGYPIQGHGVGICPYDVQRDLEQVLG